MFFLPIIHSCNASVLNKNIEKYNKTPRKFIFLSLTFYRNMANNRKIAIGFATILGLGLVGYISWWAYKKYRTSSGNPIKDNRNIQIVRS